MQTKKIVCKQKRSDANKKQNLSQCKQKRSNAKKTKTCHDANKKDRMQTKQDLQTKKKME